MIPGLEYEPATPASAGRYDDPSYAAASPSAGSLSSVDMSSPRGQATPAYNNESYHLQQVRQRRPHGGGRNGSDANGHGGEKGDDDKYAKRTRVVRKLDMFPKTERDYTVRTERGGQLTAAGYVLMAILILAEWMTWRELNKESLEHIIVDTK